ncbi:MAG: WD40 repeat domain-containing protein, partial [Chloroflexota bacterium]
MRSILLLSLLLLLVPTSIHAQETAPPVSPDNAATLRLAATLRGHDLPVNDLDFADAAPQLASGADDLTALVWDLETGEITARFEGQLNQVRSVDFAPDGRSVLTTGFNGIAFLWDVRSQTRSLSVNEDAYPSMSDGAFAPDGETFAVALGTGDVQVYDVATGDPVALYTTDELLVERVAYDPNGAYIAAGYGFPLDSTLVWDTETGDLTLSVGSDDGTMHGVAFSPDSTLLALGTGGGSLVVWDLSEASEDMPAALLHDTPDAHPGGVFDVAFNQAGTLIASAGFDGQVRLWDVTSGEIIATLQPPGEV